MNQVNQEQKQDREGRPDVALRRSIAIVSVLVSLGLWYVSFPPVFTGLFLSVAVSIFFYEILGIVAPQDSLNFELGVEGKKIQGKLLGSVAIFMLVWCATWWVLDRDITRQNLMLAILKSSKVQDQQYISIIPKALDNSISQNGSVVGRLDFSDEFESLKEADLFNPVLVKIREECSQKKGLCALPDEGFQVKIVGSDQSLAPGEAFVCEGHSYLVGETIKISPQNLPLDQLSENFPKVKIIDSTRRCYPSFRYPRLKISKQLEGSQKDLQARVGKVSYAYITGE